MSGRDDGDARAHLRTAEGFRRTLEWPEPERTYFLGAAEGTFSLYGPGGWAYHFDLEGRLRRAASPGLHYLRGLDGAVLRKRLRRPSETFEDLPPPSAGEVRDLYARVHAAVAGALEALRAAPRIAPDEAARAEALDLLSRAAAYDPVRLEAEAERFREVYEPLGILPPDRYRALILQVTSGCSWGRCRFCALYRGTPYRRKSPEEFRAHARAAKAFLGRALALKRGVFLGEANALEAPFEDLRRIFRIVAEEVPEDVVGRPGERGGISAFTDVFSEPALGRSELAELARLGLDRVYLGIESGDDDVLRALRKPATRRLAEERVRELKAAGVSVGAIFLLGAAGARSREHVEGTASLAASLSLGERDVVYLSPFVPGGRAEGLGAGDARPPSAGLAEARGEDLPAPRPEDIEREERELRERLGTLGVRVGRYDIASFVYD